MITTRISLPTMLCIAALAAGDGAAQQPATASRPRRATAESGWDALLRPVPGTANALLAIDAEAVKQTPLADRHHWADKVDGLADRPLFLPPEARRIVVAAQLDPTQHLRQEWELGVIETTAPLALEALARSEGGYVDTLGDRQVVWTPSDAYVVPLEPTLLGIMHPAARQSVSRWINTTTAEGIAASSYLRSAVGELDRDTQIVLAFDLRDVLHPHAVDQAIRETQAIHAKPEKREEIVRIVTGLQGATLLFDIDTAAELTLRLDFAENTAPFANFAQPLFEEVIDRIGIDLDEIREWRIHLDGHSASVHGQLKTTSLRRVFSLLDIPTTKFSEVEDTAASLGDTDVAAKASQAYFRSVDTLIEDLGADLKKSRDNHIVWMERYAKKIDRLPILNVDPELLAWGSTVATGLRGAALTGRLGNAQAGVQQSQLYRSYYYSYNGYGYYGNATSPEGAYSEANRQADATENIARAQTWKEIEDATAAVRQKMTQKYGVEF